MQNQGGDKPVDGFYVFSFVPFQRHPSQTFQVPQSIKNRALSTNSACLFCYIFHIYANTPQTTYFTGREIHTLFFLRIPPQSAPTLPSSCCTLKAAEITTSRRIALGSKAYRLPIIYPCTLLGPELDFLDLLMHIDHRILNHLRYFVMFPCFRGLWLDKSILILRVASDHYRQRLILL